MLLFAVFNAKAQSHPDEQQIIEKTQLLSSTIFGTKDSMTLERLFAKKASYGHSHGNLQTREESVLENQIGYCANYFTKYCNILNKTRSQKEIRYIDLVSGPGIFQMEKFRHHF